MMSATREPTEPLETDRVKEAGTVKGMKRATHLLLGVLQVDRAGGDTRDR
jgi:hypothetical protein